MGLYNNSRTTGIDFVTVLLESISLIGKTLMNLSIWMFILSKSSPPKLVNTVKLLKIC